MELPIWSKQTHLIRLRRLILKQNAGQNLEYITAYPYSKAFNICIFSDFEPFCESEDKSF